MAETTTNRIEEISDLGEDDAAAWTYWRSQEKIALKAEKGWRKRGQAIVKRYRDERGAETGTGTTRQHRFNILWSNVQTLIPVLYARTPKADVQRRFKDADPVGRFASTILERCIEYSLEEYDFDDMMASVVEDRCLPGRGVCRVMYVPHFGDPIQSFEATDAEGSVVDTPGDEGEPPAPAEQAPREVIGEEANFQYVFWEDYLEGPARKGKQVPWVRFRAYMTRKELVDRFGKQKGEKVQLDFTTRGTDNEDEKNVPDDLLKKAIIHETWDRTRGLVFWWAPGTPELILDQVNDPLGLPGFFPRPEPLMSTTTNDSRIPVADYIEYQDQARELDTLTGRIDKLTRALKVAGVYAGKEKQVLQQLIDDTGENRLIPVEDWASFSVDSGGLKGLIDWLPIQQITETLIQLYDARERVKAIIYEITGLSDIMRGSTDAGETATAQSIKASFSQKRTGPMQRKVAKFATNTIRLVASVIMQHFDPKTISEISGYPMLKPVPQAPPQPQQPQIPPAPPPQVLGRDPQTGAGAMVPNPALAQYQQQYGPAIQQFQQAQQQYQQAMQAIQAVTQANQQLQQQFDAAVALLKDKHKEGFRIDIEADSTIALDEAQDKQDRTEFVAKLLPMMQEVMPIAQGNPAIADMTKELVMFAVRGFRVARTLEEVIEKAFAAIGKMPPKTDPHQAEAQADQMKAQVEIKDTQAKAQTEAMKDQAQDQREQEDLAFREKELQQTGALEAGRLMVDAKRADDDAAAHHPMIKGLA